MKAAWVLSLAFMLVAGSNQVLTDSEDNEHPQINSSSEAFKMQQQRVLDALTRADFQAGLKKPQLGSSPSDQFQKQLDLIKTETPITVSIGKAGIKYDVILQPGHYGRPPDPGPRGTAGARVTERALVTYITNQVAQRLRQDNINVLVVSANNYLQPTARGAAFNGLRAKIFLAIHANGSGHPCSKKGGPSLGYKSQESMYAMHTIGYSLSAAAGYKYANFSSDNYTVNEAHYYMFDKVEADLLTGLLEVGELTCPAAEDQLISESGRISDNIAHALDFLVRTEP